MFLIIKKKPNIYESFIFILFLNVLIQGILNLNFCKTRYIINLFSFVLMQIPLDQNSLTTGYITIDRLLLLLFLLWVFWVGREFAIIFKKNSTHSLLKKVN